MAFPSPVPPPVTIPLFPFKLNFSSITYPPFSRSASNENQPISPLNIFDSLKGAILLEILPGRKAFWGSPRPHILGVLTHPTPRPSERSDAFGILGPGKIRVESARLARIPFAVSSRFQKRRNSGSFQFPWLCVGRVRGMGFSTQSVRNQNGQVCP